MEPGDRSSRTDEASASSSNSDVKVSIHRMSGETLQVICAVNSDVEELKTIVGKELDLRSCGLRFFLGCVELEDKKILLKDLATERSLQLAMVFDDDKPLSLVSSSSDEHLLFHDDEPSSSESSTSSKT